MKKLVKLLSFLVASGFAAVACFSFYLSGMLPDTFLITQGQELKIAGMPFLQVAANNPNVPVTLLDSGNSCNITLTLGGVIPVKTVRAKVVSRKVVTVCGTPFGIKMFANGAMVVGFSDIYSRAGYQNPAKTAGLKMGDIIISIASSKTKTNEDVKAAIQKVGESPAQVRFLRDGQEKSTTITAIYDEADGSYRTGMWVRDSSAGIGTLTFADNTIGVFGGLGHSIHDVDTGKTILLRKGEIVPVSITGIVRGESGSPGELKGRFLSVVPSGDILLNCEAGVYGTAYGYFKGTDAQVAHAQEIVPGEAQIITTINGEAPQSYSISIEKISITSEDPNKNMVIKVTDPRLLEIAGGIVQGMSGSPIIQNGMLVGAITHVLLNDPSRGYAIFAQTMLERAQQISK